MDITGDVTKWIQSAKLKYYQDGNKQQSGADAFLEMSAVVKKNITLLKVRYLRTQDFLYTRLRRVSYVRDNSNDILDKTQFLQKYDQLNETVQELIEVSNSTNTLMGDVNLSLNQLIANIKFNNKEYAEITTRLTAIDAFLAFFDSALTDLEDFENAIQNTTNIT
jgi:hypothetical protein